MTATPSNLPAPAFLPGRCHTQALDITRFFQRALTNLKIKLVPFDTKTEGVHARGYSIGDELSIRAGSPFVHKTILHEMAHIVLEHSTVSRIAMMVEKMSGDGFRLQAIREVEAETCALILVKHLGLPGHDDGINYVAGWKSAAGNLSQDSLKRVAEGAAKIYAAGTKE